MHRHANGIQALARMLRYKGNSRMTTFAPLSRLRPQVSKTANNNMYITMIVFFFRVLCNVALQLYVSLYYYWIVWSMSGLD